MVKKSRPRHDEAMRRISTTTGLMAQIARCLNKTRAAIVKWERVPAEYLPQVEAVTGIPRHVLRPDICIPPCGGNNLAHSEITE